MAGFDPDKYLAEKSMVAEAAPAFDPDAYLAEKAPSAENQPGYSKTDSALRGAAQGASLGFADEIAGAAEALWEKAKGDPKEFGELYKQFRDESRKNFESAKKANPASYTTGEVGGAVGSVLIPGMGIARGARVAQVAAKSAMLGGMAGAGYSEGEAIGDVARDAAVGATVGGALGGAAHAIAPTIGKVAAKAGSKLRGGAERMAARALGAERATVKKLGQEKVQQAGRQALDQGVLSPLSSAEKMAARNAAVKDAGGKMMGSVYDAIDDKGASTFNPLEAAAEVDDQIGGFYRSPINRGETRQLENTLESILLRGNKNIPLRDAQVLKQELGKVANWKNSLNVTDKEKMARDAYKIISRRIDDVAEKGAKEIGAEGLAEKLKAGKKLFSNASTAEELLSNRISREEGNKYFGLTDTIAGAGSLGYGATTGDWGTAAGIMVAKKGIGKYGAQNAALLLNKAGNVISKAPRAIDGASRNPNLLNRTLGEYVRPRLPKNTSRPKVGEEEEAPARGRTKWAQDGLEKLKKASPENAEKFSKLLKDEKGRRMLVAASDLKPGSKAFKKIMERIDRDYGASPSNP